ncbi:hypothetical protein [Parapedobacter koreensis]|uniref:NADPH-dependent FMN reductase n=1 Tax=Parapedobacter koreensis TaxID=332977 RepID=A0A1H7MJN8_9SPHI|nr:hypothetical protein [Parapedobacter koreensis]SEL11108.1 hypothetical protein SAMN05421740_103536 [Parapedobacter koreensis]
MKTIIISYSFTGNNDALASSIAVALDAKRIRITESKRRTTAAIFMDILFHRTPQVVFTPAGIHPDDFLIFLSPVWVGGVATPLRKCFKLLKKRTGPYAFISISGGAAGPNAKLGNELAKRMGKVPAALLDMHIADLLPQDPKPQRNDTAGYQLSAKDIQTLTHQAVKVLHETLKKYNEKPRNGENRDFLTNQL